MMPQASRVRVRGAYAAHGTGSAAARASRPVPSFLCSNPLQAAVSSNSNLRGATEVLKYLERRLLVGARWRLGGADNEGGAHGLRGVESVKGKNAGIFINKDK